MKWAPQQEQALKAVQDWLDDPFGKPFFYLAGYAGTGKTTLARELASHVDGPVYFAAYTGKAAQVLTTKGCPAKTIHQLIYIPKGKSKEKFQRLQVRLMDITSELEGFPPEQIDQHPEIIETKRRIAEEEENLSRMSFQLNTESDLLFADLVVIDEVSMVDEQVGEDLMSFGKKVLVLGDPFQLPPVRGGGYFTAGNPDFMLTDIHRQAKESPIIEMATRIRGKMDLKPGAYGECNVFPKGTSMADIVLNVDQVLCGRNKTRNAANQRIRQLLGRTSAIPEAQDRLVCLRNNHAEGLLNGQIWNAMEPAKMIETEAYQVLAFNDDLDEGSAQHLSVWAIEPQWYNRQDYNEFTWGYALTCHKAQGSQWDEVLVMDESSAFRNDRYRWLYTAVTRAAKRIDIVEM